MDGFVKFLEMGGYAAWVWPSYAIAVAGLAGMLAMTLRSLKAREKEFEALKQSRQDGDS